MTLLNMKLLMILLASMLIISVTAKVKPGKSMWKALKNKSKRAGTKGVKPRKANSYGYSSPAPITYGPSTLSSTYGSQTQSSSFSDGAPVPVSTSYGSPAPLAYESPTDNSVDLHDKEFCVDVSTYQPVVWVERDEEECKTDFVLQCEEKSENVCADVTETFCEVSVVCILSIQCIIKYDILQE